MPQVGPQAATLLEHGRLGSHNDHTAIRTCLLEELRQAVRGCIRESAAMKGRDTPLTPDIVCVATLCNAIEMVLKHGLVHKNSSDPTSFWWFVCEAVRMDPQFCVDARLASSVALVDKSANLQTPTGKHRGWIRHALNANTLSELLTILVYPEGHIAAQRDAWYYDFALLRTEGEHFIAGIAAALSCVKFKLPVNDSHLDKAFVVPNKKVEKVVDTDSPRRAANSAAGSASEITAAGRAVLSRLGSGGNGTSSGSGISVTDRQWVSKQPADTKAAASTAQPVSTINAADAESSSTAPKPSTVQPPIRRSRPPRTDSLSPQPSGSLSTSAQATAVPAPAAGESSDAGVTAGGSNTAAMAEELVRLREMNSEIEMVFEALAADLARINAQVFECAALANSVDDEVLTPMPNGADSAALSSSSVLSADAIVGLSAVTGQAQALTCNVSRLHERLMRMYAK